MLCSGCDNAKYDYREEEKSKLMDSTLYGDVTTEFLSDPILSSPIKVDGAIRSIDETLFESELFIYGYSLYLDRASVYFNLSNNNVYDGVTLTLELYDAEQNLLTTVETEPLDYAGTFPAKAYFTSSEEVKYVRVVNFVFSNSDYVVTEGAQFNIGSGSGDVTWERESNTTLTCSAKYDCLVALLNQNGVQIDAVELHKGKQQVVTYSEVTAFRIIGR